MASWIRPPVRLLPIISATTDFTRDRQSFNPTSLKFSPQASPANPLPTPHPQARL
jgi:hypothetical protein